jgi:hypothetical protein
VWSYSGPNRSRSCAVRRLAFIRQTSTATTMTAATPITTQPQTGIRGRRPGTKRERDPRPRDDRHRERNEREQADAWHEEEPDRDRDEESEDGHGHGYGLPASPA